MSFKIAAKLEGAQNYRQYAELKNIETCKLFASAKYFPGLNYFVDRAKGLWPETVHDCPYTVSVAFVSFTFLVIFFPLPLGNEV